MNKKPAKTAELPTELYQHVDDNWGSPGVEGAEYIYNLFVGEIRDLQEAVEELEHSQERWFSVEADLHEATGLLAQATALLTNR